MPSLTSSLCACTCSCVPLYSSPQYCSPPNYTRVACTVLSCTSILCVAAQQLVGNMPYFIAFSRQGHALFLQTNVCKAQVQDAHPNVRTPSHAHPHTHVRTPAHVHTHVRTPAHAHPNVHIHYAQECQIPIYAIKGGNVPSLTRAFRTLLGVDPSAGTKTSLDIACVCGRYRVGGNSIKGNSGNILLILNKGNTVQVLQQVQRLPVCAWPC